MLSVLICAKNELHNIKDCVNSVVQLADEIVVIDDFSEDGTDKEALALDIHAVLMCNGDMNLRNLTDHMTQEDNDHDGLARYLISYFDLSL